MLREFKPSLQVAAGVTEEEYPTHPRASNNSMQPIPGYGSGAGALVTLTPQLWRTLTRVNAHVNHRATYELEPKGQDHGRPLSSAGWKGDCEDFALEKQRQLIAAGVNPRALRIASVSEDPDKPLSSNHAVLVVRTNQGDLVLDNDKGTSEIRHWQDTGYTFLGLQSPRQESRYNAVTDTAVTRTAATPERDIAIRSQRVGSEIQETANVVLLTNQPIQLGEFSCQAPAGTFVATKSFNTADTVTEVTPVIGRTENNAIHASFTALTLTQEAAKTNTSPTRNASPSDRPAPEIHLTTDKAPSEQTRIGHVIIGAQGRMVSESAGQRQTLLTELEKHGQALSTLGVQCEGGNQPRQHADGSISSPAAASSLTLFTIKALEETPVTSSPPPTPPVARPEGRSH